MTNPSRRDFLKLLTKGLLTLSGALALGGLIRFLDFQTNPAPKTEFDLGLAANYPINSRTLLADVPAVLLHTKNGFSALSLVCTHLGCSVESDAGGFACPCHGSRFDSDGNVTHGPAAQSLTSLRIEITEANRLILHTD
ncbi:MAG: Rieske (2Fe-2S) protein [Anaerolineales bacterium]|nr:Rieske (2Fe-2S) protein [Anaerolineales bacterium]